MELYAGFILGFLGSLHCLGMCGPLVIALPSHSDNKLVITFQSILYNLGRVFTYTLMGGILGYLGSSLPIAEYQEKISLSLGIIILIVYFFRGYITKPFNKIKIVNKFSIKFKLFFGKVMMGKGYFNSFLIGFLNGLLPCGLVYVALASSIAFADLYRGSIYMLLFGVGTIPMMFTIYLVRNLIGLKFKQKFQKLVPAAVLFLSLILILRGLELGIPMISPVMPKQVETKQELKEHEDLPPCCR